MAQFPVMILPRHAKKIILCEAVRFALKNRIISETLREKNTALEKELSEVKLINRAKAVMMKYLCLSEDEAHIQLRKRAMDQRQTLAQTAADIIRTYEYL